MGKKLKKKAPQKKKTSQRNSDSRRDNWPLAGSKNSHSESSQIEHEQGNEVSGTNFWSSSDTFICLCNIEDIGSDRERSIEAEVKRLADKIRDQQDLFSKRLCAFKEEVTTLKAELEEGHKVMKQYKEKEDKCQKVQDQVTSLGNEGNEKSTTIERVKDISIYYEIIEAKFLSLKEDLENNQNEEIPQADEEQENDILKLRKQMEEGRKVEEIFKKQYLEKEEQYQVEVNILKCKLEETDKPLRFQDSNKILDNIHSSQRSPTIKIGLGFHEFVEAESGSQDEAMNSNEKYKIINKEMRGQPHQQQRK